MTVEFAVKCFSAGWAAFCLGLVLPIFFGYFPGARQFSLILGFTLGAHAALAVYLYGPA